MVFRGSYDPNSLDATYDNDSQSYRAIEFVESEPASLFFSFVAFFFFVNCRADKGHPYTDDELTDLEFSDKNLNLHLIMEIKG